MQKETNGKPPRFMTEFYNIGRLAMCAIEVLSYVCVFCVGQGSEGGEFNVYPPEKHMPKFAKEKLQELAAGANAAPLKEGCFFVQQLCLPEMKSFGAVCFVRDGGVWSDADVPRLESLATIYAYALRASREHYYASAQNLVWNHIMDNTMACIYVTDPETDEILFMNRAMKHAFGLNAPEGQLCWKVLQRGQTTRCSFCPVNMLVENPDMTCHTWEEHNTVTGRLYKNYDSLMYWTNGQLVHLQHSTDVTETSRLYQAAMLDELTGAHSRFAGKEMLEKLIRECTDAEQPLCVCLFDINGLKTVNDMHGHASGDMLLAQVAATVRGLLRGREYLMRLSGDEFVAVLLDVRQADAAARMQEALSQFNQMRPAFFHEAAAFCYGIVEVRGPISVRDVLARADERMYQQKRALHIRRAQVKSDTSQQLSFSYDVDHLYDALTLSTDSYIYVCNMQTHTFRYPPAMVEEFGLPGEIISNAAAVWETKVHPHDKRIFFEANQEIADGHVDAHCIEYRVRNVRGEWVWLQCRGHLERDKNGEPCLFAGFITNLGQKSRRDPLTGLFHKFELEKDIMYMLRADKPHPLTFMILGMDGLKRINSLYDRIFGDEVIRITAQSLQALLPPNAVLYRLDGDEFCILMHGDSREEANRTFCHIQETFDRQQTFEDKKFYCTLSCGCAFAPADGMSYVDLARCAAYALEYAKYRGRNRMEYYTDEIVAERRRMLEMSELLRESIEQGFKGFEMHYQPMFNTSRELIGAEALARWRCDKYGAVTPGEFIPLLEQTGLILPVGRWIFEEALRTCVRWQKYMPNFTMGVNLSYVQLEDETFVDFMLDVVHKTGVTPRNVVLELTESYLAANMMQIADRLTSIRSSGMLMAMDDFGTGYSSLSILKGAPIDIAKIDRTFVKGVQSSTFDSAFLRLVVELCSMLGIRTCLEGVETEAEFDAVQPMSFNYIQGFLLGHPMSAADFEENFFSDFP